MVEPSLESLIAKLNEHKNLVLQVAQASLPQPHQFDAFRTIVLNQFGRSGFQGELEEAFRKMERNGTGRNTQAGTEVPK